MSAKKSKSKKPKKKAALRDPRSADTHALYEMSVQAPDLDAKFYARYFKKYTGRPLRLFREDFCGTFVLSTEFVKRHPENRAICVDLDGPTLDWGRRHNLSKLDEAAQSRVQIFQEDVMKLHEPQAEMIIASNFSYCIFKEREQLEAYFRSCFQSLQAGGLMSVDMWGGSETQIEQEEEREIDAEDYGYEDFTYVWDQHSFDPLSYHAVCKIHFLFEDGSRRDNAFVYDWRLWTAPDLREAMEKAGFVDVHVLWEGTDKKTDEGNGKFTRRKTGDADEAWIAYMVGQKP